MIDLTDTTLFCADCVDADRAIHALERCKAACNFGAVKFFTSLQTSYPHIEIPKMSSLVDYSVFMLKRAVDFIETEKVLVVQHDGYIINESSWDESWRSLDYIGPFFLQDSVEDWRRVGSGGFSLRSRRLMQYVMGRTPYWDGTAEHAAKIQPEIGLYEDGFICHKLREYLQAVGCVFGTMDQAAHFAQGGYPEWRSVNRDDRRYYVRRPFGFHGPWGNVNRVTGEVLPPPFGPPGEFEPFQKPEERL